MRKKQKMECKVVSKTIQYGRRFWRLNADGSWLALAFGVFSPRDTNPRHGWINVPSEKVPDEVKAKGDL